MDSQKEKSGGVKVWKILLIIFGGLMGILVISLFLGFLVTVIALGSSGSTTTTGNGNVAVIPLVGPIYSDGLTSGIGGSYSSAETIADFIKEADKSSKIDVIVIDINSPGGTAVASDVIATALKNAEKPTYALIRDIGASGGYLVASAADHIVAYRMSLAGSIGVRGGYLEFSGLMEKYGVGYERLVAGDYKDAGTPFRKLTDEEREIIQSQLDIMHDIFIEEVAANRGLPIEDIAKIADGQVFVGTQALELGLIDYLGGEDKLIELIKEETGKDPTYVVYEKKVTIFDLLAGFSTDASVNIGRGIGESLKESESQYPSLTI